MSYFISILIFFYSSSAWAMETIPSNMQPVYDNPLVDMVYPQVSGDYLVYSQRVNHIYQVIQLKRNDLYGAADDVSPSFDREAIQNGVALNNGDIAYVSNRLGNIGLWVASKYQHSTFTMSVFQDLLLPNHIDASDDGAIWVFDSALESTRYARIANQYSDDLLHRQLFGQAWRMYHAKYWAYKSDYPATKQGVNNKFKKPNLFTFKRDHDALNLLSDGFDASLSVDGESMVFVREIEGNFDLWQQNIDGSNLTRLTRNTFADLEPSLSPDGKRIVFVSNRDAAGEVLSTSIYTLDIATGNIKRLTFGKDVTDGGPAWLDENTIIFHSNRDPNAPNSDTVDNWRLWTVKVLL